MVEACPHPACRHPWAYHRDSGRAGIVRPCASEGCPCPGWNDANLIAAARAASAGNGGEHPAA